MIPAVLPVYLRDEILGLERDARPLALDVPLMERAGLAVAEQARAMMDDKARRILLVAGPGNNGGDAFVAARHLKQWWFDVAVLFAGEAEKLPGDAQAAFSRWRDAGGKVISDFPDPPQAGLIVDGLFGIGLRRPIEGKHAEVVRRVNAASRPVLSIDIPSGLDANTGAVLGHAIRARQTITFLGLKAGLLTLDGPDYAGEIHLDELGVAGFASTSTKGTLIPDSIVHTVLAPRQGNSHKGSYGTVGIIGGAPGMVGAALLAGRAALRLGAGKVRVGLLADGPEVDALQPELMLRPVQDVLHGEDLDCIACGPGLGQSQAAAHALAAAIAKPLPLVLDADALNLLATDTSQAQALAARQAPTLLTPHPAEAGRLLGIATRNVQDDRIAAAVEIARRTRAAVVLKGNGSICAFPDGKWAINTSGNPGMASAGMGDVLTGILAALLAQGAEPAEALLAGVHLHGRAADRLVDTGVGPVGMTASELIDAARACLNSGQAEAK